MEGIDKSQVHANFMTFSANKLIKIFLANIGQIFVKFHNSMKTTKDKW